jgi:hypothetical protein
MQTPIQQPAEDSKYKICTHIIASKDSAPARRCGAPALRGQAFCYFHHPSRKRVANPNERRARRIARQSFPLTLPTNRLELMLTLNEIISRLATNQIDVRRAGLLLFAIQVACQTLPSSVSQP